MPSNLKNDFKMVPNPYGFGGYGLPQTDCTAERRLFFKRLKEIHAFMLISDMALTMCKKQYHEHFIPNLSLKENTPIRLFTDRENFFVTTVTGIIELCSNGIHILTRQALVMFYGSFETYLYQLFEKSFLKVGISDPETILDKSRDILMMKKWDGKFCKMNDVFNIGYKSSDLINFFTGFEMVFWEKEHKNPLKFLDELALVRHRIVHASSILETGEMICIDSKDFFALSIFFFRLTDYVDSLFAKRFSYDRQKLDTEKV